MTAAAVFTPCTQEMQDADIELNRTSLRLLQSAIRADLPTGTKLVAMMLCCHHNNTAGCAWPSTDRLAKLCGMHRRTVISHLASLKNLGLLLVGKVSGVRTPAYALQENALQNIALDGIVWAKNMLGGAEFIQPPAAPNMAKPAKNAGITTQGTEGTEELTELGGTEATPEPTSPAPALFASQPQNPQQPTAVHSQTAADASAFAQLIDRINAQRASNGKRAFALADLAQLRTEAAKAGITAQQAAEWILERTGRNFFKADYFAPPAPAPAAPTAPAQPAPQPAQPAPALTPEQSAEQEAAAAAARAKLKAMCAKPASAATPALAQNASTLVVGKTGHAWADKALADALAGKPVNMRPLEQACQVAKVSYSDVRAAAMLATA